MAVRIIDGQVHEVRKVYRFGGSLGIFLPVDWALCAGITVGDEILLRLVPGEGTSSPKLEVSKWEDKDSE